VTETVDGVEMLRRVGEYQFGAGAGGVLFPSGGDLSLTRTSSGRPRQAHAPGGRIATYEPDGRLRLGFEGGRRLSKEWSGEATYSVVVGDESVPHVRAERNAFAKFVREADSVIRPRDEVVVEHPEEGVLAVGRAELSGPGMLDFDTGVAVSVREGGQSS
jgi:Prefoldin, molecular chaperone implicated in de novo protein folding, alpha subunit